jgi:hypothetical protein
MLAVAQVYPMSGGLPEQSAIGSQGLAAAPAGARESLAP